MILGHRKTTSFFVRFRNWFLALIVSMLVVFVSLFFWQSFSSSQSLEGLFSLEKAEMAFSVWEGASSQERDSLSLDLASQMADLNSWSMNGTTRARFLFLRGRYELVVEENSQVALVTFQEIGAKYYQYAPSLLYQAFIFEKQEDMDQALTVYQKLSGLQDPLFRSQGVFYQAVLRERKGEVALAKLLYSSLVKDYPEMIWGKLSKNRLIFLEF